MPLGRLFSRHTAAVSGRAHRGLSALAAHPPWVMMAPLSLIQSPAPRASSLFAKPPRASHLAVPEHLLHRQPRPGSGSDSFSVPGWTGSAAATSGDGLLLLKFLDDRATAAADAILAGKAAGTKLHDLYRDNDMNFICNPVTGELFRLPDPEGTWKAASTHRPPSALGILTQSQGSHGPPDRFAVAQLMDEDPEGCARSFRLRRFLSQTGEWDTLEGLPLPLPLRPARRMYMRPASVAFAGRLWWCDLTWGAVSADPFSDRPELRFYELPSCSVLTPSTIRGIAAAWVHRIMAPSEGKLLYVEVSEKEPFVLSSFSLDEDSSSWMLEHRVALSQLWPHGDQPCGEVMLRVSFVDPLNSSIFHLTNSICDFSVDMDSREVLSCSMRSAATGPACVLPPWLGSSRIPSAGTPSSTKTNAKSKTLSDILVRADKRKEN